MIVLLALLILFAGCSHDSGVSSEKEPLAIVESSETFFEMSSSSVAKHLVSSAMESPFSSSPQEGFSNSQPVVSSSSRAPLSSVSEPPQSSSSEPPRSSDSNPVLSSSVKPPQSSATPSADAPIEFQFYTGADISTVQEYERNKTLI